MKLMIVESPAKIKTLKGILGADWEVAASYGHVRDLPPDELGIDIPGFKLKYTWIQGLQKKDAAGKPIKGQFYPSSQERVSKLKDLTKEANQIYFASDPDREGEAISWHLQECLGVKEPLRITFGALESKEITAAVNSPRVIDMHLVEAQEARRALDRLVGYLVSPVLSNLTSQKLSAGRVQSPAVRLVVDREREINAFKQTLHFGARLTFKNNISSPWIAEWLTKPNFVTDDHPYFMDKSFAESIANIKQVQVLKFLESTEKRRPPAPFITSTYLQAVSVTLNIDPDRAMQIAQKLKDAGHITYHRTDNPNVTDESIPEIQAIADKMGLNMAPNKRTFKAAEGAQIGHPAIMPTHWEIDTAGDNEAEQAIYRLIRNRAIASQLADAQYAARTAKLCATKDDGHLIEFEAKGRTLISKGWLALVAGDQTTEDDHEGGEFDNPIPILSAGDKLDVFEGHVIEKKTIAPARYTKASLVKKLETEGVGRPSTFATIMSNITGRAYVVSKGKFLQPSELGMLIVDSLVGRFSFIEIGFTRDIEYELDLIAQGQSSYQAVIENVYARLQSELAKLNQDMPAVQQPNIPCPKCGKQLFRSKSKFKKNEYYWSCSGYQQGCKTIMADKDGKPVAKTTTDVLSEHICPNPNCKKPLIFRQGTVKQGINKGKHYSLWGCSGFPQCKETFNDLNGSPQFNKE